jgi:rare lipoprotein A
MACDARFPSRPIAAPLVALCFAALLAGCASGPKSVGRDGPAANPPSGLNDVPDAEPRIEPIRAGGPNRPYEVLGRSYSPIASDQPVSERGLASWYGRKFHGRRTASGEVYDMYAMTAAHKTMPLPSYARVRNPANGREIVVRVNDRGPFHAGRIIDLSYTAALKLGVLNGVAPVEVERITFEEIRSGAWRRDGATRLAQQQLPAPAAAEDQTTVVRAADVVPVAVEAGAAPSEPIADAPPARALTSAARGWWIQLGAFRQRDGAEAFHRRVAADLDWLAPLLAVFSDVSMFRLQAGPYPSRDEARAGAERVREALQLVPVVIEKR